MQNPGHKVCSHGGEGRRLAGYHSSKVKNMSIRIQCDYPNVLDQFEMNKCHVQTFHGVAVCSMRRHNDNEQSIIPTPKK